MQTFVNAKKILGDDAAFDFEAVKRIFAVNFGTEYEAAIRAALDAGVPFSVELLERERGKSVLLPSGILESRLLDVGYDTGLFSGLNPSVAFRRESPHWVLIRTEAMEETRGKNETWEERQCSRAAKTIWWLERHVRDREQKHGEYVPCCMNFLFAAALLLRTGRDILPTDEVRVCGNVADHKATPEELDRFAGQHGGVVSPIAMVTLASGPSQIVEIRRNSANAAYAFYADVRWQDDYFDANVAMAAAIMPDLEAMS